MEASFFAFDSELARDNLRNIIILCKNGLTPEFLIELPRELFQEVIKISNKLVDEEIKEGSGGGDEDPKSIGQLYPDKFGKVR